MQKELKCRTKIINSMLEGEEEGEKQLAMLEAVRVAMLAREVKEGPLEGQGKVDQAFALASASALVDLELVVEQLEEVVASSSELERLRRADEVDRHVKVDFELQVNVRLPIHASHPLNLS